MERDFNTISENQKKYLKFDYSKRIENIKTCLLKNYMFILKIVQPYSYMFKYEKNVKLIKLFVE